MYYVSVLTAFEIAYKIGEHVGLATQTVGWLEHYHGTRKLAKSTPYRIDWGLYTYL